MKTETQPKAMRVRTIGNAPEDTDLITGFTERLETFEDCEFGSVMELAAKGADGACYVGPVFSLC